MATNREEYYQRICNYLEKMTGGDWYNLSDYIGTPLMPVADAQQHFIQAVKRFITEGRDWQLFGNVYFNSDYSRIYKCESPHRFTVKKASS